MGPLGIITAIVSAIRVAGSPSLKAFIGRAQEPPGIAELELLSCTSTSTAELWSDGGIARIFGKPKILEVVRRVNRAPLMNSGGKDKEISVNSDSFEMIDSNVTWKRKTLKRSIRIMKRTTTVAVHDRESMIDSGPFAPSSLSDVEYHPSSHNNDDEKFPSPNLSLNIGIKRKRKEWFQATALIGIILQSG